MSSSAPTSAGCLVVDAEDLLLRRDLPAALRRFDQAQALGEDADRCSAGRWVAYMLSGQFSRAWLESDAIRARGGHDPHRFWNGESITGKRVIVRCLHGLGDAVQMLRYLPLVRERGVYVVAEVAPPLFELARHIPGPDQVITWGAEAPPQAPAWDVQMEVMELPYFFRTQVDDLPLTTRYIRVPEQARTRVATLMGERMQPRIGLVWSASDWDVTRCLPMKCLARLLSVSGVEFWNLQGGKHYDLTAGDPLLAGVRDAGQSNGTVLDFAAVVEQMDLVITVDTLAAHLAGALGKPAWVLLKHAADWRWMHGRNDSPWYPTLKLCRQHQPGDWDDVVEEVVADLDHWRRSCL